MDSFGADISVGLGGKVKWIPSKYHYDERGSRLFQDIMALPEYYPTPCELQILSTHAPAILPLLNFRPNFKVVELGCGDGLKTVEILRAFFKAPSEFAYVPVDICAEAVDNACRRMREDLPLLRMEPLVGDYFIILDQLRLKDSECLFLFLGGNIGNFTHEGTMDFLGRIWKRMANKDKILIGFDLQKNPEVIAKAYNDSQGVTKAFNLNLLERIKRELKGDLNMADFDFTSNYNPKTGEVRSYIVSLRSQSFRSPILDQTFTFEKGEKIYTELSKKFTLSEIESLATSLRFNVVQNFMDDRNYYAVSLWEKGSNIKSDSKHNSILNPILTLNSDTISN